MSENTILITGGTSGIGYALAAQLLERGNTVLVTGRTEERLAAVRQSLPGVHTYVCDQRDPAAIGRLCSDATRGFPKLNILINNAGIGLKLNLNDTGGELEDLEKEIKTNLTGPIQMVEQFLPQLKRQKSAAIVNVTSGLAFVPMPLKPIYCATKAAMHSYTQSLRVQLKNSSVEGNRARAASDEDRFQQGPGGIKFRKIDGCERARPSGPPGLGAGLGRNTTGTELYIAPDGPPLPSYDR